MFALSVASWQILVGSQRVVNLGDLAWFGAAMFQILAPLQLAVAMPFATLLVASSVALEKDRKTIELLLMSRLSNSELVLGKLFASLLIVVVVLVSTLPLLLIFSLLGGVSMEQIIQGQAVTLAAAFAAGSLGSLFALWREKTFQALAMSALVLVLWVAGWEVLASRGAEIQYFGQTASHWAVILSPWRAVQEATRPRFGAADEAGIFANPVLLNIFASLVMATLLNGLAIARVRAWNLLREVRIGRSNTEDDGPLPGQTVQLQSASIHSAGGRLRAVWDNPILWREICTWAFGKKVLIIRAAYLMVFAVSVAATLAARSETSVGGTNGALSAEVAPVAAMMVVSLILVNALTVTSITNERDSRALDLLLVTDLSPREIVTGKLGGAFYNTKEMILLPAAACVYLWFTDRLSTENLVFIFLGWTVMSMFAAVLGLHAGITYANSRTAIATSIGTLLFLFLGIATCMRIMLAFTSTFEYQFGAFIGFIAGGSIGMYVALNWRYRSMAINIVAFFTPLLTFVVITNYLLGHYGAVFIVTALTYGFATAAMLVPAITVFDVAIGNSAAQDD